MSSDRKPVAEQLELGAPPRPRRRSHRVADTSLAARGNNRSKGPSGVKALILAHISEASRDPRRAGATADEVHHLSATTIAESADVRRLMNIRRRVSDLVTEGKIRETMLRRPNAEGNPVIVWTIVEVSNG